MLVAQQPLAQGMARVLDLFMAVLAILLGIGILRTHSYDTFHQLPVLPFTLLTLVWLLYPFISSGRTKRVLFQQLVRIFVQLAYLTRPRKHLHIVRVLLFQLVQVPQQVYPAALVLSWEVVVTTVEVARHHSSKARPHYSFGYRSCPALVILV